jgi:deoxyribodipyrimidine photo-lyase
VQKLEQQPEMETRCLHPVFEGMREPYFNPAFLTAWQEGKTGYPLVDACMRSLHRNGWINFRMRAMLVSFASYDLWLDWRLTAPFLARLFTDYEPGIHYAQFQMQSGVTGMNAIRLYNPIKQSEEHDPEGVFIRKYVPELKDVPEEFIHEPWLMAEPPDNYPAPIVDHEIVSRFAREQIKQRRQAAGFKTVAKKLVKELGSRRKKSTKTKKLKPDKNPSQLDLLK